ncbi:hypothetical protein NMY22_g11459 [Coprinellus aureogranulatus]|nr:hypothetical protein NMY22_g11459 [Coprinellus aureogranulatus]
MSLQVGEDEPGITYALNWGLTNGLWLPTTEQVKRGTSITEYWYKPQDDTPGPIIKTYNLRFKADGGHSQADSRYIFYYANGWRREIVVTSGKLAEYELDGILSMPAPTVLSVTIVPVDKEAGG